MADQLYVEVTYRNIALFGEPVALERIDDSRWFLPTESPMPVGTVVRFGARGDAGVDARVVGVVEQRRKGRSASAERPGMTLLVEQDAADGIAAAAVEMREGTELSDDAIAVAEGIAIEAEGAMQARDDGPSAAETMTPDEPAIDAAAEEPAAIDEPAADDAIDEPAAAEQTAEELDAIGAPAVDEHAIEAAPSVEAAQQERQPIVIEVEAALPEQAQPAPVATAQTGDDSEQDEEADNDNDNGNGDGDQPRKKKRRRRRKKR